MDNFTVSITPEASKNFLELLHDQGLDAETTYLRLAVSGGSGCSGLSYGLSLSDAIDIEDSVIESNGAKILVDAFSAQYLNGAEIQWTDDMMGGFKIDNPNSTGGCGCGRSFSTEGVEPVEGGCGSCSHQE